MQLSYNLIKNKSAVSSREKQIETNYVRKPRLDEVALDSDKSTKFDIKASYEKLGADIIRKAKSEAEAIIMGSRQNAVLIEKEAYEKGYAQGKQNGYEDGFDKGYKESIERVKQETKDKVKEKIEIAERILASANTEYLDYINTKEKEIVALAFEMAKAIAGRELKKDEGIMPLVEDILNESKNEENIIIRCNKVHIKPIEEKIEYYKKAYSIKGEIFILEDPLMEEGNAIVEKNSGKAIVGMDVALEKLEEALFK
ncbi:MAG: flagellar biosynthesis/type III secretory pathway-like protein [Clostridiales bacterium]|jgi:flagellar assembly protein FliH|nr:flagellar biosynthesis/type III secretory pathway-like protein [Clostridiales bacterium]NLZ48435.1 flagellar biosynthesis/type III secretory pathway-like protein [Clostridiales bacterium]